MGRLLPPVQELLTEAEESLGTGIKLVEDASLPVAGTTAVIRGRPNYGSVRYSPKYRDCVNYVVANQCCRILRYTRAPPEYRVVPVQRSGAYSSIRAEVEQHARKTGLRLPEQAFDEFARLLLNGTVVQVTSAPADCRIDRWLYTHVPSVRDEEMTALRKMLELYSGSLDSHLKQWTPCVIYRASNAMNGAFAKSAVGLFPDLDGCAAKYREEFGDLLDRLSAELDGDDGYLSDVRTADAWAERLGIRLLYEWKHESEIRLGK